MVMAPLNDNVNDKCNIKLLIIPLKQISIGVRISNSFRYFASKPFVSLFNHNWLTLTRFSPSMQIFLSVVWLPV